MTNYAKLILIDMRIADTTTLSHK